MTTPALPVPSSLSPLPNGWTLRALGDVAEFLDSRRVPVNEIDRNKKVAGKRQEELFPYYGANGRVGWIDGYLFDEPLILLAEDGGAFGSPTQPIAYAVSGRFWVNNHAHVLRPKTGIDFRFLLHALRVRPDVGDLITGTTRGKLNQQIAASIPVPLPPLDEQRRIAAILDEQMAAIERARTAAEQQLAAARALPASYLRTVFESDEAHKWPTTTLDDILVLRKDVIHPYNNPIGLTTFVGLEHIGSGTGERIGGVEVEMSALTGRKPQFFAGDIVYGYLRPYLNKVWLADFDGLCSVDQYVFDVREERAIPAFVAWFMRSPTYLERAPIDTTPGQLPRIRTEEVVSVTISLPTPEEQWRVVNVIGDALAASGLAREGIEAQLRSINSLSASSLRAAFRGEL